jgi:hypothetical protein
MQCGDFCVARGKCDVCHNEREVCSRVIEDEEFYLCRSCLMKVRMSEGYELRGRKERVNFDCECGRPAVAKGLCMRCYMRKRRNG